MYYGRMAYLFMRAVAHSSIDAPKCKKAKRVFMNFLNQYNEQGRNVNVSGGSNYAPKLFAADDGAEGITKQMFNKAMNTFFSKKKILNEETKRAKRIVRSQA